MKSVFGKAFKKLKKDKTMDKAIVGSSDFRALCVMNAVMNLYDEISKIDNEKFNEMEGDELYLNARFSANNFLSSILERLSNEIEAEGVINNEVDATV